MVVPATSAPDPESLIEGSALDPALAAASQAIDPSAGLVLLLVPAESATGKVIDDDDNEEEEDKKLP